MNAPPVASEDSHAVSRRRFGWAWLALTIAFGLHVADEALTDFLSFYNPMVLSIRARYPWFPAPTWEFRPWLTGLIVGVAVMLLLTAIAFRGSRGLALFAYFYAGLMIVNGLGHLSFSVARSAWVSGATSSPLLLVTAIWLLVNARRVRRA